MNTRSETASSVENAQSQSENEKNANKTKQRKQQIQKVRMELSQESNLNYPLEARHHKQLFEEYLKEYYFRQECKTRSSQIVTSKTYYEILDLLNRPDQILSLTERKKK